MRARVRVRVRVGARVRVRVRVGVRVRVRGALLVERDRHVLARRAPPLGVEDSPKQVDGQDGGLHVPLLPVPHRHPHALPRLVVAVAGLYGERAVVPAPREPNRLLSLVPLDEDLVRVRVKG